MVSNGGKDYSADSNVVKNILKQLSDLPTKRYAGKGRDTWAKYEVTDSAASLVTLKASKQTVAEIYIGKFAYNQPKDQQPQMQARQQRGDMTTYVRLADEKDVYAVDGFLKMGLSSNINSYRIRSLVKCESGRYYPHYFRRARQQESPRKPGWKVASQWRSCRLNQGCQVPSTLARLTGKQIYRPGCSSVNPSLFVKDRRQ